MALGRVGNGLPTAAHLAFQAAHAAARDAVHAAFDLESAAATLQTAGLETRIAQSRCPDRARYLLRPDLGRDLDPASDAALRSAPCPGALVFLLCDGLSALAVQRHAAPLIAACMPVLRAAGVAIGPAVLARQGRVALGDAVGEALGAAAITVLIGERPGLSASDSLGVYLTWAPGRGRTDAERNCISNIHGAGLGIREAAAKLVWLVCEMHHLRLSGVALKEASPDRLIE